MRSATPSMWPNIMVAEVFIPSSWATRMVVSQASASHLPMPILRRTAGAKISPPPPGMESRPAFRICRMTPRSFVSSESPGGSKKCTNSTSSGGLKAWTCSAGNRSLIASSSSRYQASGRSGFMPPCMRICVPPISTTCWIFSSNCAVVSV